MSMMKLWCILRISVSRASSAFSLSRYEHPLPPPNTITYSALTTGHSTRLAPSERLYASDSASDHRACWESIETAEADPRHSTLLSRVLQTTAHPSTTFIATQTTQCIRAETAVCGGSSGLEGEGDVQQWTTSAGTHGH